MTNLRTTVNSYDLFDTLLARRCVAPYGVFLEVERALGANGFADARRAAEYRLAAGGQPFDIYTIYDQLVAGGTLTRPDATRLLMAEIDCEFDNATPIAENLRQVTEGDLVVSDMYLPREILRRLLRHIGLHVHVELFVSNAGKHNGAIWPHLLQRWLIVHHLGDNPRADLEIPRQHGIPCSHYVGAGLAANEQQLVQAGQPALARVVRALRLGNPYAAGTRESELWGLATQINLPLLALFAAEARRRRDALGRQRLLFSARDCFFLADVFATLYPAEPAAYVHVSREALTVDREALRRYLVEAGLDTALVCDIAATGSSWYGFAATHPVPIALVSMVFIDNWPPARVPPLQVMASDRLRFSWLARSSELSAYSTAIEVLNMAPHGTCTGIEAAGALPIPRLEPTDEIAPELMHLLQQANAAGNAELRKQRVAVIAELATLPDAGLVRSLLETISQSPLLMLLGEKLQWPKSFGPTTR